MIDFVLPVSNKKLVSKLLACPKRDISRPAVDIGCEMVVPHKRDLCTPLLIRKLLSFPILEKDDSFKGEFKWWWFPTEIPRGLPVGLRWVVSCGRVEDEGNEGGGC